MSKSVNFLSTLKKHVPAVHDKLVKNPKFDADKHNTLRAVRGLDGPDGLTDAELMQALDSIFKENGDDPRKADAMIYGTDNNTAAPREAAE